ncbi:spore germination protein [Neobacillus sp. PS3-40]|uniref:spore germination protein n=1 Tax=Neobacillus sp. PS3-40 TaxID=3070679 RepID=UPI0027E001B2|nr:spore germination protein [Neobacillus sp. PS3-40]WML45941.1 spore germination protein [Neobacillus sp. PS3-40]
MECSINIGNFKVISITNNANINFQSTFQNSHTANSTIIGGCFNFGDYCTNSCTQDNQSSGIGVPKSENSQL